MSLSTQARHHFRHHHNAVLGTVSLAVPGYPFVSVVPYIVDEQAWPVILVSRLAEHTRNLDADARTSLFVREDVADVQAGARVTLLGKAKYLEDPRPIRERYFRYFQQARNYYDALDFDFYLIEPVTLRVVAGFARVHWVSREAYTIAEDAVVRNETAIIDYVHRHHASDLKRYCAAAAGGEGKDAELVGVDCEGFDIRAGERIVRTDFQAPVTTPHVAQEALIALLAAPDAGA